MTIKFRSAEISGFGNKDDDVDGLGYELGCQRMLYLGLQWIKDKPITVWSGSHGYSGVYGVFSTSQGIKELEKFWNEDNFLDKIGYT